MSRAFYKQRILQKPETAAHKTQRPAGHSKRQTVFLNGLSCWVLSQSLVVGEEVLWFYEVFKL